MPSSIWTGSIGFGLVQVPVRLVSATKSRDVSFNQLEAGTNSRVRYRKVSEVTGDEVTSDRIVKGYELRKGQYVVIEPQELEAIAPASTHTIEIEEFVDLADIDPVFFEQPYYLAPDKNGAKPYRLLVDAMTQMNKVAIGRVVLRQKERLVAIRPLDGVLVVETMRYHDEVLPADQLVEDVDAELTEKERSMARALIEALSSDEFDATKYTDQYREQVLALIEKKAAGEEIVAAPSGDQPAKVLDLVAALEASLARGAHSEDHGAEGDGRAASG